LGWRQRGRRARERRGHWTQPGVDDRRDRNAAVRAGTLRGGGQGL